MAELLLADQAEVDAKAADGYTPLHFAASVGDKDLVDLLLASKAQVNARANDGGTPLHFAADTGHRDVAELLSQHGGHE